MQSCFCCHAEEKFCTTPEKGKYLVTKSNSLLILMWTNLFSITAIFEPKKHQLLIPIFQINVILQSSCNAALASVWGASSNPPKPSCHEHLKVLPSRLSVHRDLLASQGSTAHPVHPWVLPTFLSLLVLYIPLSKDGSLSWDSHTALWNDLQVCWDLLILHGYACKKCFHIPQKNNVNNKSTQKLINASNLACTNKLIFYFPCNKQRLAGLPCGFSGASGKRPAADISEPSGISSWRLMEISTDYYRSKACYGS